MHLPPNYLHQIYNIQGNIIKNLFTSFSQLIRINLQLLKCNFKFLFNLSNFLLNLFNFHVQKLATISNKREVKMHHTYFYVMVEKDLKSASIVDTTNPN